MRKLMKNVFLGISGIASIYFVSLVMGHPPRGIEQVILYSFPGGILMFFLFDPILNTFGERAKQVQDDNEVLDSIRNEDSIITINESEFPPSVEKEIASGIEESDASGNKLLNIRNKILDCAGPTCIRLADEEEIISLGEEAVPVAADVLKNVTSANQGLLTMALLHFANNGNALADQTLTDIAEGKIQVDPMSYGDIALSQAQMYVAEKQDLSPKNLWLEASEFDKAGQYDKAIVNYKMYRELVPDDVYALLAIGNMHKNANQLIEAIDWWDQALANGLKHPHAGIVVKNIEEAKASLEVSTKSSESQENRAGQLHVGMPYDEIVNILGQPTASMGGNEVVDVTQNVGAEVPGPLANMMGSKTFMEWNTPEGIYKLVIENNKLANIFIVPD